MRVSPATTARILVTIFSHRIPQKYPRESGVHLPSSTRTGGRGMDDAWPEGQPGRRTADVQQQKRGLSPQSSHSTRPAQHHPSTPPLQSPPLPSPPLSPSPSINRHLQARQQGAQTEPRTSPPAQWCLRTVDLHAWPAAYLTHEARCAHRAHHDPQQPLLCPPHREPLTHCASVLNVAAADPRSPEWASETVRDDID